MSHTHSHLGVYLQKQALLGKNQIAVWKNHISSLHVVFFHNIFCLRCLNVFCFKCHIVVTNKKGIKYNGRFCYRSMISDKVAQNGVTATTQKCIIFT